MIDLEKLDQYYKIYIQPHNYPDADAIAASYGMYELLLSLGIDSEIVCYTPRTASIKPNLDKMLREIEDKITFSVNTIPNDEESYALILIDVQHGNSNIKSLNAKYIYCIDHHEDESTDIYVDYDIRSSIGSSSTIITDYFKKYNIVPSELCATLLSFGIYQDTGSLSEKTTNLDTDCKMWLNNKYNKPLYDTLIHSSFTFSDLVIIADALKSSEQYRNVVFCKVNTADDNMLGNISDTLSEISDVDISVAYAEKNNGWKLSIRSYNRVLTAVDIVQFLTSNFSIKGGGHLNKSGGFISYTDFHKLYENITFDIWLKSELISLLNEWNSALILSNKTTVPHDIIDSSITIEKIQNPVRYIKLSDIVSETVNVRTLTGTVSVNPKTHYIMIGIFGDIYPISISTFNKLYDIANNVTIYCLGDEAIEQSYRKEGYGIKIGSIKYKIEDILNLPIALPSATKRRSYKLDTPCVLFRSDGVLKGSEGDYIILDNNNYPTHISKKDIYMKSFKETALHVY